MSVPNTPVRSNTSSTDDDPMLGDDTSEVTRLFYERLSAWRHATIYLADYLKSHEKMQLANAKEADRVLKTINSPLKEGEQFDRNPGGIAGLFDNIRVNTQAVSTSHTQAADQLKRSVIPIFDRLEKDIKAKQKELTKGVGKGAKAVDKAKADTAKQLDALSTYSSSYTRVSAKDAANDPYVLHRGVHHRLHKQFQEENSNKADLVAVQNNFAQFETHVVSTFQQGLALFTQTVTTQTDMQRTQYADMAACASAVDPQHEWTLFIQKNSATLIDPNAPPKSLANATFPNQNHPSTKPLCAGNLERKSGVLRKWESSHYVLTPAGFLHEFKSPAGSTEDLNKDPSPDLSLHLADCTVGTLNGNLFSIKGKDQSKSKLAGAISSSKEYEFRAIQGHDAETWYGIVQGMAGLKPGDTLTPALSPPTSPGLAVRERQQLAGAGAGADQATGTTPAPGTATEDFTPRDVTHASAAQSADAAPAPGTAE